MLIPLIALAAVGVAVASASSRSNATAGRVLLLRTAVGRGGDLEAQFAAQHERGAAERAAREKESRAEVDAWYAKAKSIPLVGYYFAAMGPLFAQAMDYATEIGNAIARWNAPDWNSAEEKDRVRADLAAFAMMGLAPPNPMPDDEFKTYADLLDRHLDKLRELWARYPEDRLFLDRLVAFVRANPQLPLVQDVTQLRVKGKPVWPPMADLRGGTLDGPGSPWAMAIATVAAAMRGKDPAQLRAVVRDYQTRWLPKNNPALNFWDNFQWQLHGVLQAAREG